MSKQIEFSGDARKKLADGVDQLADAVVSTLGPQGRNVIIYEKGRPPKSTKDGVTVAKNIELEDPIEDAGAQTVKEAAIKTADVAGDGTTTATLLARALFKEGLKYGDKENNLVEIKRGMEEGSRIVIKNLKKMSEDISDASQLKQIATLSANNDTFIGNLLAEAFDKVGHEGVITIEESKTHETYLESVEGLQFDRGYKSPYFVTDNGSMTAKLNDPYILLWDGRITSVSDILPLLESLSQKDKSLLIIAQDIDGEALAALIVNKMRGTLKVCAVKAPDFGDRRTHIMEDIAAVTGGRVLSSQKADRLDKVTDDDLGTARAINISKDKTTIIDGNGKEEDIENRLEDIKTQIEQTTSSFAKEQLQARLGKMSGGVAILNVGGFTEAELSEKKDRVEDALHATKAAVEEGILPGGGVALMYASSGFEYNGENLDFDIGLQLVELACKKPFQQILENAGVDSVQAKMYQLSLLEIEGKPWDGFDVSTKKVINTKDEGIIDPTKVTRSALQNAVSVAGTLLTTECLIVDKETDEKPTNPFEGMM